MAGQSPMTEGSSVTVFVMGERLPWPDDSSLPDEIGPLDEGVVYRFGEGKECTIRKISALGATLRGELGRTPGDDVAIELVTGQRPGGIVEWVKGGETGISFTHPVDILALINRKLVSQPVERRTTPRVEHRCRVHIKCGGALSIATMRNISARGMQVEGEELPEKGTYLSVLIEGLIVPPGEVIWKKGNLAGIELFEELSWSSIMPWIRGVVRSGAQ
jgi:PilZ domain-containing protein